MQEDERPAGSVDLVVQLDAVDVRVRAYAFLASPFALRVAFGLILGNRDSS